ncbi:hypothetical protein [Hellea balneolensis]|uniref:hypothetical protein n=1 Tax=Hellea balneolensis TaxID=287478 RepID=UPI0003F85EB4|nr:hypothetical protein [Hellea balneolensis]
MRRTYEALYHHGYDFAVMARSCLWLEAHGLDGIGLIIRSLPDLETPAREIKLSEPTYNHFLLEGYGRCLIPFVNASADLAIAGAQTNGFGRIDFLNIFGRLNIFAALKKSARFNLYAAAIWYDATEGRTHILWLKSSKDLPDYYILNEVHHGPWGESGLSFLCSTTADVITKAVSAILPEGHAPYKTGRQFSQAYSAALDSGIAVSHQTYAQLNKIADRLLVPSTDASRRGAGE